MAIDKRIAREGTNENVAGKPPWRDTVVMAINEVSRQMFYYSRTLAGVVVCNLTNDESLAEMSSAIGDLFVRLPAIQLVIWHCPHNSLIRNCVYVHTQDYAGQSSYLSAHKHIV